nr:hypothetical protein Iba_chr10bCG7870 [Ipomoea batatas]
MWSESSDLSKASATIRVGMMAQNNNHSNEYPAMAPDCNPPGLQLPRIQKRYAHQQPRPGEQPRKRRRSREFLPLRFIAAVDVHSLGVIKASLSLPLPLVSQ